MSIIDELLDELTQPASTESTTIIEDITEKPEIVDDNIDENDEDAAHFAQFIKDSAKEPEKPPSIADMYMSHLSAPRMMPGYSTRAKEVYSRYGLYSDEFDDLPTNTVIDKVSSKSTYHPSTSGYTKYSGIGKNRKWSNQSHKYAQYLDEDEEEPGPIETAINLVSDRVDVIYDCVKSTDQLINDMYERQIVTGDAIEELTEAGQNTTLRTVEISSRLSTLEKSNNKFAAELSKLTTAVADMDSIVREIREMLFNQSLRTNA